MGWTVSLTPQALRQLERLDRSVIERIGSFIDERLVEAEDPKAIGHALTGDHRGRWTYRVGDYRLICEFHNRNWWWPSSRSVTAGVCTTNAT